MIILAEKLNVVFLIFDETERLLNFWICSVLKVGSCLIEV